MREMHGQVGTILHHLHPLHQFGTILHQFAQEVEMKERLSRVEQLLIQVLGEKQLPTETETQSQYQSAEQLLEDHQLSADQFDSAVGRISYRTTVEQDSFMEEENEEDGMAQLGDPYNIPEEEEFFLASQDSSRSPSNQSKSLSKKGLQSV